MSTLLVTGTLLDALIMLANRSDHAQLAGDRSPPLLNVAIFGKLFRLTEVDCNAKQNQRPAALE